MEHEKGSGRKRKRKKNIQICRKKERWIQTETGRGIQRKTDRQTQFLSLPLPAVTSQTFHMPLLRSDSRYGTWQGTRAK